MQTKIAFAIDVSTSTVIQRLDRDRRSDLTTRVALEPDAQNSRSMDTLREKE